MTARASRRKVVTPERAAMPSYRPSLKATLVAAGLATVLVVGGSAGAVVGKRDHLEEH